jgi:hypothetical protein
MGFTISKRFADAATSKSGKGGGYLNPSKLADGGSVKFHIVSDEPLEFWECWIESPDGQLKPLRFLDDPTPEDIEAELGGYSRRMNRDGNGVEPAKPAMAFTVFNLDTETIQVCQFSQKLLIAELTSIVQDDDTSDLTQFDLKLGRQGLMLDTKYSLRPVPTKAGTHKKALDALAAAEADGYDIKRLIQGGNPFSAE